MVTESFVRKARRISISFKVFHVHSCKCTDFASAYVHHHHHHHHKIKRTAVERRPSERTLGQLLPCLNFYLSRQLHWRVSWGSLGFFFFWLAGCWTMHCDRHALFLFVGFHGLFNRGRFHSMVAIRRRFVCRCKLSTCRCRCIYR
jgi:hypothetical protein